MEDDINNEMTGMAAPAPDEAPMSPEPQPDMPESKFDMETLMGNFMDMPQERRQLATRLLASPATALFDEIVGEPVMQRLVAQLDQPLDVSPEPAPDTGMMAPSTEPMADMPMENEDSTPPV